MNGVTRAALVAGSAVTAAGLAGVIAAPWYYQPRPLTRALQRTWPDVVFEVDTPRPEIAITFDDGPHPPYTEAVLDILRSYDARATFFLMGEQIVKNPTTFHRLVGEGHEAGNHFFDNRPTLLMRDQEILDSLDRTEALLGAANPSHLVRPSSGISRATTRQRLRERGFQVVVGSAYTSDCTHPPRAYMRWAFKQMLEPGRILILHDGRRDRQRTVDVLPFVLEQARQQGLKPVTVTELLAGSTPDHSGAA